MQTLKNVLYVVLVIAAIPIAVVVVPVVAMAHAAVHLRAWWRGNPPRVRSSSGGALG